MHIADPIQAQRSNRDIVLAKCQFFQDVQVWPITSKLDAERWLSNFEKAEEEYAIHLLNAVIYLPAVFISEMFGSALNNLFCSVVDHFTLDFTEACERWADFLDNIIVTTVTGEQPSIADSGYAFARLARDVGGLGEHQLLAPSDAVRECYTKKDTVVVFVDDFVGSGNQCVETWEREYEYSPGEFGSFKDANANHGVTVMYIPLLCTSYGYNNIARDCAGLILRPVHILSSDFDVVSPTSKMWPPNLVAGAEQFITIANARAGLTDYRGFHELGLALAFSHCVPDATIPILRESSASWNPLFAL